MRTTKSLEAAASDAVKVIAAATEAAAKTIAEAAGAATRVVSTNAAEAAKIVQVSTLAEHDFLQRTWGADHDLLLKVNANVDTLMVSVEKLSARDENRVSRQEFTDHLQKENDHEARLRTLEAAMWKWIGYSSAAAFITSMAVVLGSRFIHA